MEKENRAKDFLLAQGLDASCYDYEEYIAGFSSEMKKGLAGEGSSLLMIPTYLDIASGAMPLGETIAIDAGGTNLRVALVKFEDGKSPVIERYEKYRIPGAEEEIEKDEFFSRVAAYLGDLTAISEKVGFCFSFPCSIDSDCDGKIIEFDKEIRVKDSAGVSISAELNAALARAGKPEVCVTVLNDSAAALIGSAYVNEAHGRKDCVGLICGTGLNVCYYEESKSMLINTEAGGYNGLKQTRCDRELDEESERPGMQCLEKMVSGAYFSNLAMRVVRLAAEEGVFSGPTGRRLKDLSGVDAICIDAFLNAGGSLETELGSLCATKEDAALLFDIFDGLYERAAKVVAICMAAILKRIGASSLEPALIAAEGSVFEKGFLFEERFVKYLDIAMGESGTYELISADAPALIGAAAAVFL